MSRNVLIIVSSFVTLLLGATSLSHAGNARSIPDWAQWARTPQHTGATSAVGQSPNRQLVDITFDPFAAQEQAETYGELLTHYQSPLIDGNKVFLEAKSGTYISCQPPGSGMPYPCGPDAWNSQIWNERAFVWQGSSLTQLWNFQSDWKPVPNGRDLSGWEPVFHAAWWNGFVFVPGFAGTIYKLNESDGTVVDQYKPFGPIDDPNKYVSGPLTVDRNGNVYFNAVGLDPSNPWGVDVTGAWLVKVSPIGVIQSVSYSALVPGAPTMCDGSPCGSQRPGINAAPAISNDGMTVYTVSRAHFFSDRGYVVAATANLMPKWQATLRGLFANSSALVWDQSSSSPVVAPDGSVLYGASSSRNTARGYLLKFDSAGKYLANYNFGWDETPAIYAHDGTYSIILKDNHYFTGPYYITQLSTDLVPEWRFRSPTSYEWCVNAPAVDANGTVYANSEDGNVYVISQGGTLKGNIFLRLALGAAYTPIAIGRDGKIYTENDGDMFVVGK
ncbi:MAG: hypothetical protein LAO03_03300 [Acidobacteriia bacterium]|nr:hypothetical protein [Terriglobia bacterium]